MSHTSENKRPLSPHIQVYKPQLTSVMSIMHRLTGVALFFGCFMITCWLMGIANNGPQFQNFHQFMSGWVGRILLFGWSFALIYHLLNGMRHLIWDSGKCLDLKSTYRTGWAVIIGSVVITAAIWCKAYALI